MRFSLLDLLVAVAFCAGIAWCASFAGYDNGLFWFVVGVSAVMSALFVRLARNERHRWRALWATVPVVLFSLVLLSLTLLLNAALLTIAVVIFAQRRPPTIRTLCNVSMSSVLAALAVGIVPGIVELHKLEAIRRELPIVSLTSRLQYERRHSPSPASRESIISPAVVTALAKFEQDQAVGNYRQLQFQRLHDYQYELFVRAMGFGVSRMRPLWAESLRRPPLRDIRSDETAANDPAADWGAWRAFQLAGKANTVDQMHRVSRNDFLDADSFGIGIEPPLKVTGFVEHGFHYPPGAAWQDDPTWTIERLELVSLLKFDEPRVYVLDHLPRMDQLSSDTAPTRPLDAFESDSLRQLWTAQDLVVAHQGTKCRMLGSLRAAKQCLDCHSVERGELLGAFSYSLHRSSSGDEP